MEYRSNSNKSKENKSSEKKRAQKIISGNVKSRKKSGVQKFADAFLQEDMRSVTAYIFTDVLIPATKKMIEDVLTNGVRMTLWGDREYEHKRNNASRVSYRNYYDDRRDRRGFSARNNHHYDDYIFDSRGEAEEVLNAMDEIIDVYGVVSVLDFFDLVGVSSTPNDNKYGWTNIRNAKVIRVRDGYVIKLPKTLPID